MKVREELQDQSWTRGLWRMNTVQEMVEFVTLWDLVQQVKASRPLIQVLVINDNGLWINDFI